MTGATTTKLTGTLTFPAAAVEAKLRASLLDSIKSTAALQGIALPVTITGQYAATVHLDSLGVVDLLCDVEPILGFQLKDSIVKSGGYHTINDAIGDVMPRIESAWKKHVSKGGKK
jgi:hypothetical protein